MLHRVVVDIMFLVAAPENKDGLPETIIYDIELEMAHDHDRLLAGAEPASPRRVGVAAESALVHSPQNYP